MELEGKITYIQECFNVSRTMLAAIIDIPAKHIGLKPESEEKIDNYYNYLSLMVKLGFPKEELLCHINEPFDLEDDCSRSIGYYLRGCGVEVKNTKS